MVCSERVGGFDRLLLIKASLGIFRSRIEDMRYLVFISLSDGRYVPYDWCRRSFDILCDLGIRR